MKKNLLLLVLTLAIWGNAAQAQTKKAAPIAVQIDLVNIVDDKVTVTLITPKFTKDDVVFNIPKIIPGTYSVDDYGKFIENVSAFDAAGKTLSVEKKTTILGALKTEPSWQKLPTK